MKKILISLFLSLFFIGCLDYTQYVTVDGNKNITVVAIVTMSKSLVELAASSEGNENTIPDYYYDDILREMEDEARNNYPRNFKFKKINNENEIGIYINGVIKLDDLTEDYSSLVPIKDGNKFIFNAYDYYDIKDDYSEYSSILSSMKMKLIISKDYIPRISSCYLSSYDEVKDINVYDLKDSFLIELPMVYGISISRPILYIEM
ncbi:hypothetical protein [Brachyspira sp.]|uniref:hypothetical protein n=1 Tax=Brachyspira sp. TaxID=1977261 RepID=UPI00262DB4A9|nr:hypothetical protein [Brachyspira sp.]